MRTVFAVLAVFLFFVSGCATAPATAQKPVSNAPAATSQPVAELTAPAKNLRLAQKPAPAHSPVSMQYSGAVTDAPQDHLSTKSDAGPSVAYKQMYAPRWGGNVRQVVFYNGCNRSILSQYPPSDEMNRFWQMLLTLPPKQGLAEWGASYYARWAPINGRWTLVEGNSCQDRPCQPVQQSLAIPAPAPAPMAVAPLPQLAPQIIYQPVPTPAPAPAPAKPRVPYSNPACVKQLEEWGYEDREGIKEFQRKMIITADGVAGPETCRYVSLKALANDP